jgi:hypothetical protein
MGFKIKVELKYISVKYVEERCYKNFKIALRVLKK